MNELPLSDEMLAVERALAELPLGETYCEPARSRACVDPRPEGACSVRQRKCANLGLHCRPSGGDCRVGKSVVFGTELWRQYGRAIGDSRAQSAGGVSARTGA